LTLTPTASPRALTAPWRAQTFARRFPYVLQCDIKQYFPSIDHAVLRQLISAKIMDPEVLWLVDQILASGQGVLSEEYEMSYFPGDDLFAFFRPRGLPIGNLTSQFWANVYLNVFDHFVKRHLRCQAYVRYVDDFLLFAEDKPILWQWKTSLEQYLQKLRLLIHAGTQPRPVSQGFPFLGFIVFPQRRRLKRRKGIYFVRKFKRLSIAYRNGEISLSALNASVQGWVNHVRYANTIGLRKAVFASPIYRSA
jgi:hypothetical protein